MIERYKLVLTGEIKKIQLNGGAETFIEGDKEERIGIEDGRLTPLYTGYLVGQK